MNMDEYQLAALRTAAPKDKPNEVFHLVLGLVGEAGEIAEKFKKLVRGDVDKIDEEDLKKELGDVLWYVAVLADHFDVPLDEVAEKNIAKLKSRQERGQIKGSGDNR